MRTADRRFTSILIATASIVCLMASSCPDATVRVPPDDPALNRSVALSAGDLEQVLRDCALSADVYRGKVVMNYATRVDGSRFTMRAHGRYVTDAAAFRFTIDEIDVLRGGSNVDHAAVRRDLGGKLTRCLGQ